MVAAAAVVVVVARRPRGRAGGAGEEREVPQHYLIHARTDAPPFVPLSSKAPRCSRVRQTNHMISAHICRHDSAGTQR
jgi:hypothetical protein